MYAVLARWSAFVEAAAPRLLNGRVVYTALAVFVVSFFSYRLAVMAWINAVAAVGLLLLLVLWLADRYRRKPPANY